MKAIDLDHLTQNRLCFAFSPERATREQLKTLALINYLVTTSKDTDELRSKLVDAACQCLEAIDTMNRELGVVGKKNIKMDSRKAT